MRKQTDYEAVKVQGSYRSIISQEAHFVKARLLENAHFTRLPGFLHMRIQQDRFDDGHGFLIRLFGKDGTYPFAIDQKLMLLVLVVL